MTDTTNIDSADILIVGNYTSNENVEDSLNELFGNLNQPNSVVRLNDSGLVDSDLLPSTSIKKYLISSQVIDKTDIQTKVNRIDKHIEQMKATQIFYSSDNYLLDGDANRPIEKLSYIEYGAGNNDALVSLIYSPQGKLIRVDYYLDRSTYMLDGSGRSGFNSITYNNLGKLKSSVFTGLQEI